MNTYCFIMYALIAFVLAYFVGKFIASDIASGFEYHKIIVNDSKGLIAEIECRGRITTLNFDIPMLIEAHRHGDDAVINLRSR